MARLTPDARIRVLLWRNAGKLGGDSSLPFNIRRQLASSAQQLLYARSITYASARAGACGLLIEYARANDECARDARGRHARGGDVSRERYCRTSLSLIKRDLVTFLWDHFLAHFNPDSLYTFHLVCPCSSCSS